MKRSSILWSTVAAGLLVGLAACSSDTGGTSSPSAKSAADGAPATSTINVVASTDVWGDVASTIGGGKVAVTSIIDKPDADPHEYEANARNQLALAKADVVIENGGGYDDFMSRMLKSAKNDKATVLNAVDISGRTASDGEELNEHVWYDFPTVEKVVDRIEQSYAMADPSASDTFSTNADQLKSKINKLEHREASLKKTYAGQPVAITEPVPLYLLDAIGLVNKTPDDFSEAIEEDSDVSAKVLKQTLDLYSRHRVKLLAYNEQTTGPETDRVLDAAKASGIPVVPVTETLPSGKNYVTWMTSNLDAVDTALGQ